MFDKIKRYEDFKISYPSLANWVESQNKNDVWVDSDGVGYNIHDRDEFTDKHLKNAYKGFEKHDDQIRSIHGEYAYSLFKDMLQILKNEIKKRNL